MILIQEDLLDEPEGYAFRNEIYHKFSKKKWLRKQVTISENIDLVVGDHDVLKIKEDFPNYPSFLPYGRKIIPVEKFFSCSLPIFIKPQKQKSFPAQIIHETEMLRNFKNKKVFISYIVEFLVEYRFYVKGEK